LKESSVQNLEEQSNRTFCRGELDLHLREREMESQRTLGKMTTKRKEAEVPYMGCSKGDGTRGLLTIFRREGVLAIKKGLRRVDLSSHSRLISGGRTMGVST